MIVLAVSWWSLETECDQQGWLAGQQSITSQD
jgi:hypothetical protein